MKRILTFVATIAAGTMLASAQEAKPAPAAATTQPACKAGEAKAPGAKKADPEMLFKKIDKDADGSLTLDEFKGKRDAAKAEAMFKKKDANGDGKISLDEFKAAPKKAEKKAAK